MSWEALLFLGKLLIIFIAIFVCFFYYLNSQGLLSLEKGFSLESIIDICLIFVLVAVTAYYAYQTRLLVDINQKHMKRDWVRQKIITICDVLDEFSGEKNIFEERGYIWSTDGMYISRPKKISDINLLLKYPDCNECYSYYTKEYEPNLEKLTEYLRELIVHTNEFLESGGYRDVLPDDVELNYVDIRKIRDFIVRKLIIDNMSGDEKKKYELLKNWADSNFMFATEVHDKMKKIGMDDDTQYNKINELTGMIKQNDKNVINQINELNELSEKLKSSAMHIESKLQSIIKKLSEEYAIPEDCTRKDESTIPESVIKVIPR